VFSVIFFLYVYYQKIFDNKFILFFIILFSYSGAIFSGDRSPLFILTFALCIYLIFNNNIKLSKKIIMILAAIFCFSSIYYFSENLRHKIQYSFDQLGIESASKLLFTLDLEIKKKQKKIIIYNTKEHIYVEQTAEGYVFAGEESFELYKDETKKSIKRDFLKTKWGAHFITAFEIGKTNYILGSGIKTFRYECLNDKYISDIVNHSASYRCATHPHNLYFEVFSEAGLLGLLIFFYLHYLIFRKVIKIKNGDIKITAISIFIVLFFPIQTTGSYFSTFNGIFYFMNLPVIIYLANKFGLNSKIIHT